MIGRRVDRRPLGALAVALLAARAAAQEPWRVEVGPQHGERISEDLHVVTITGGFRIVGPDVDIRADRALVWLDVDDLQAVEREKTGELPRRGLEPPSPRRRLGEAELRRRLEAFLRAATRAAATEPLAARGAPFSLELARAFYLEGDVSVIEKGREIASAGSIFFSAPDDRVILRDAELRLWSSDRAGVERVFTVRGERLVRQGIRTTGRDVSLTSCAAGKPHFEVKLEQIEVIERPTDFEIRTRGGRLALSGTSILPLPNTTFRTSDQTNIPLRGLSAGYSGTQGAFGEISVGGTINSLGKSLHELFGSPQEDFRGDWFAGLGFIEKRGFPIEPGLTYEVPGLYRGYAQGFFLDDHGTNRREITRNFDGSPIDEEQRYLVRSENRIYLGTSTYLDLTAWDASDPAVWSEFYRREYREERIPETSAYVRHADENVLLTAKARVNATGFSYGQDRALAPFFPEELPLATFDVFSEPILSLPGEAPLLLTSSGSAGYLRKNFDDTLAMSDESLLRVDEELTLSVPFRAGALGLEPFTAARVTWYDRSVTDDDATRGAFTYGIRAGTWLGRSWSWLGADGSPRSLRHTISPTITVRDRFEVTEDPGSLEQFDQIDALDERTEIAVELLNRVVQSDTGVDFDEALWLDLEQLFYPDADRDNAGDEVGLLLYELRMSPRATWLPLPNLDLLFQGKHDWHRGKERTIDVATRFGKVAGLNWRFEYRGDETMDGTITYGASTGRVGRWELLANSQYDLEEDRTRNYLFRVVRFDHDWNLEIGVIFDTIGDETRFFVNFQPTLGGLFQPRSRDFVIGS